MIHYENLRAVNARFEVEIGAAVARVLDSGWFILGQEVAAFEAEFAAYVGSRYCVGVGNGLDALTLSMRALEMPAGAEVLVASNTYIATILGIVHAGLRPILVEPEMSSYNIDPGLMASAVTERTRAVCVTHLYGKSCRMTEVAGVAATYGLHIIEDCAQSHGARRGAQMTGTFGIAGCFSFYPTKNLGALGDAGAITTNDEQFADRLRYWRNYGSKKKYFNAYPGLNSRLDELQAAILRVKLPFLDGINKHKRALASLYLNGLPQGLALPAVERDAFDVFHIFPIRHPRRDELRAFLREKGIGTEVHYPVPPHEQVGMRAYISGRYPISEEIHATELSLPISAASTEAEVEQVCGAVAEFEAAAQATV